MLKKYQYHIVFFLLIISPYILSDMYYGDDLFRSQKGYFGWSDDGRYFAEQFYRVLSLGSSTLPDSYPIPLLISGAFFIFVFDKTLKNLNIDNSFISALLMAVMLSCPLLVANFSFRYDSAFMLLSIAFAILPFALCFKQKYLNFISSVIALSISISFYQASLNVFIGFSAATFFFLSIKKEEAIKLFLFAIKQISALGLSYLVYKYFLLKLSSQSEYANNFNKIIELNTIGFNKLLQNISQTKNLVTILLDSGMLLPFIICSVFLFSYSLFQSVIKRNLFIIPSLFITVIFLLLSISGVALLGENAKFYPRIFIGMSVLLLFFPMSIYLLSKNVRLTSVCAAIFIIPSLIINQTSVNSIKNELRMYDRISISIIQNLDSLGLKNIDKLLIIGSPDITRETMVNISAFPVIAEFLPYHINEGYDGGRFSLMKNGMQNITYPNKKPERLSKLK